MNNEAIKKIEELIFSYENASNLSEYAKGRLSAFRLALEILKHV